MNGAQLKDLADRLTVAAAGTAAYSQIADLKQQASRYYDDETVDLTEPFTLLAEIITQALDRTRQHGDPARTSRNARRPGPQPGASRKW